MRINNFNKKIILNNFNDQLDCYDIDFLYSEDKEVNYIMITELESLNQDYIVVKNPKDINKIISNISSTIELIFTKTYGV